MEGSILSMEVAISKPIIGLSFCDAQLDWAVARRPRVKCRLHLLRHLRKSLEHLVAWKGGSFVGWQQDLALGDECEVAVLVVVAVVKECFGKC